MSDPVQLYIYGRDHILLDDGSWKAVTREHSDSLVCPIPENAVSYTSNAEAWRKADEFSKGHDAHVVMVHDNRVRDVGEPDWRDYEDELSDLKRDIHSEIVKYLNSVFEADPNAMHCLICNRVPANSALVEHPHAVVRSSPALGDTPEMAQFGVVGLLAGLATHLGLEPIATMFSDPDENGISRVVGFCKYEAPEQGVA